MRLMINLFTTNHFVVVKFRTIYKPLELPSQRTRNCLLLLIKINLVISLLVELQQIIEQIGYKLNVDLVLHLFQKFENKEQSPYDTQIIGKLKFDAFIELLVIFAALPTSSRSMDNDQSGVATIEYLDFFCSKSAVCPCDECCLLELQTTILKSRMMI